MKVILARALIILGTVAMMLAAFWLLGMIVWLDWATISFINTGIIGLGVAMLIVFSIFGQNSTPR